MSIATKLGRVMTYHEELLPIKPLKLKDNMVLQDHVTNYTHYITTTTMPMATKHDRMVAYHEGFSPIKPNDLLIT